MHYKIIAIVFSLIFLGFPFSASADFYKYLDEKGTVHLTNDINTVPEKYRKKMKVIEEKKKEEPAQLYERESVEIVTEESWQEREGGAVDKTPAPSTTNINKTSGIVAAYIIALMLALTVMKKYLHNRKINILIFLLLTGAIFTYLLRTYAIEAQKTYSDLKKQAEEVQGAMGEKSEERAKILEELSKTDRDAN